MEVVDLTDYVEEGSTEQKNSGQIIKQAKLDDYLDYDDGEDPFASLKDMDDEDFVDDFVPSASNLKNSTQFSVTQTENEKSNHLLNKSNNSSSLSLTRSDEHKQKDFDIDFADSYSRELTKEQLMKVDSELNQLRFECVF